MKHQRTYLGSRHISAAESVGLGATILGCIGVWALLIGLEFAAAWMFEWLWNWLMPLIFHLPTLTFWEAFGCVMLLSFIGGFFKSTNKAS